MLGGVGGYLFYTVQDPVYSAQSTVLVLPTAGGVDSSVDSSRTTSSVQIETEAEVAHSALVATDASTALKGAVTPEGLLEGSTVTVTPNSQVLTVTFEAGTPELARDGSQAMAQAYLDRRSADAQASVDAAKKTLQTQQAAQIKARDDAFAALAAADNIADVNKRLNAKAVAQAKLSLALAQLTDISSRQIALEVTTTDGGQIVSEAQLPQAPVSPVLWIDVAAGLFIGALVGSGILLLDRRRIAARADGGLLEPALSSPPVTRVVPVPIPQVAASPAPQAIDGPPTSSDQPSVTDHAPTTEIPAPHVARDAATGLQVLASLVLSDAAPLGDAGQAALRALSAEVDKIDQHEGPVVLVGVDYPGLMAQAAYAINDAWVVERGGSALVLTEKTTPAVPGRPTAAGRGLTDVLSGEWKALDTVVPLTGVRSAVVGPGQDDGELPPATQRRRLQNLWSELDGKYGSTLVHVQVPFDGALVQSVMQTAGPVLVVVKAGISQQQDLEYAIEQLTWLGVVDHVVGVVSVSGGRPTPAAPPMTARQLAKAKADQAAAAAALEDTSVEPPQAEANGSAEVNGSAQSGQDTTLTPRGAGRGGS